MKIKFLKDHPAGIKKDHVKEVGTAFGQRMIDSEYAVMHEEQAPALPVAEPAQDGAKKAEKPPKSTKKA